MGRADPDQAFCTVCFQPIYAGDAICPSGVPLARSWEQQFNRELDEREPGRQAQEVGGASTARRGRRS